MLLFVILGEKPFSKESRKYGSLLRNLERLHLPPFLFLGTSA